MVKRLEVVLDDHELREIRSSARRHRLTTAPGCGGCSKGDRPGAPVGSRGKVGGHPALSSARLPRMDIDQMLKEIDRFSG